MYSFNGYRYYLLICVFIVACTIDSGEAYLRNTVIVTPAPAKNSSAGGNGGGGDADGGDGRFKDLGAAGGTSDAGSSDTVLVGKVGSNVKTQAYDPMMYEGSSGGPVTGPDDLECQGGRICCWQNGGDNNSTAGGGSAGLRWRTGHGAVDKDKFNANFDNPQTTPDDYYLIAYSNGKKSTNERALFESCSINCAEGNIEVKFRYWTTPGVFLQVCTRDVFFGDSKSLSDCRDAAASGNKKQQSGQAKVNINGGNLLAVDIVASGFTAESGSVAIMDHLAVSFKPCQSNGGGGGDSGKGSPTTTTGSPSEKAATTSVPKATKESGENENSGGSHPSSSKDNNNKNNNNNNQAACRNLACQFSDDTMCGYKEYRLTRSSPLHATKGFAVRRGRFDNFLTGVQPPPDGSPYAAAYLYGGDNVALESAHLKLGDSMVLRFSSYIAAQGLRIRVCLDTENTCPLTTAGDVNVTARKKWTTHYVHLPKDTAQVFFIAENAGFNQGGVGIGNVQLLRPSKDGDALHATESACGTSLRMW